MTHIGLHSANVPQYAIHVVLSMLSMFALWLLRAGSLPAPCARLATCVAERRVLPYLTLALAAYPRHALALESPVPLQQDANDDAIGGAMQLLKGENVDAGGGAAPLLKGANEDTEGDTPFPNGANEDIGGACCCCACRCCCACACCC